MSKKLSEIQDELSKLSSEVAALRQRLEDVHQQELSWAALVTADHYRITEIADQCDVLQSEVYELYVVISDAQTAMAPIHVKVRRWLSRVITDLLSD